MAEEHAAAVGKERYRRGEFRTFAVILVMIVGALMIVYWYDRRLDFISTQAKQLFQFLIE